jgi:hypothetical protein
VSTAAVFSFGGLGILVESVERSHLVWLEEFLTPHFEVRADAPHACRVRLVEDRRRYDAALAAGPGDGALDAFALDGSVVRLPRWRGAKTRLFDAEREAFYELAGPPLAVTILSAPGNWKGRTALMRVVRELATNHAQRAGGLLLHACAFAAGGRGVVVTGAKEAGKTTLLVHALHAPAVEYVSNDRLLIPPGTPPRGRGVPTIVALRPEMLGLFPGLAERLAGTGYYQRLTLEEAAGRPTPAAGQRSDRPRLSPAQLCTLLGVRARAEVEIAVLVFPTIAGEPGAFSLRRLSPAEVEAHLEGALFGIRPGRWSSDVFTLAGDGPAPDRAALAERCRALAARVAGVECRLGLNAYASASAADDLVAALLG